MDRKECFKCRRSLPMSEFYRHSQMADGHLGKCKACAKTDVQENYKRRRNYYRTYYKERDQTPERKEFKLDQQRKHRSHSPEKNKARAAVGRAIRSGRLVRQPCERCGSESVHAHHDDYSKPLDVRWLCVACHHKVHQEMKQLQKS